MSTKAAVLQVPFHRADLGEEEVQAVSDVIRSGWLTMGAKTFEFEKQFARYVGASHAIAVSSCTAALHLALEAVGVKRGDEVLVPTTTFTATAEVVTYFGARPVFVDVDPITLNIDPADAERRITPRTKAIIPVHVAGTPCEMCDIGEITRRHGVRVIEDAAHALPSSYHGQRVGTISDLTAFSFYATKTLTTGEGGMITTEDAECAKHLQVMRLHGIARDAWKRYSAEGSWFYEVLEAGYKYNFTDLQAALGVAQLAKCDDMFVARQRIAERYTDAFRDIAALQVPSVPQNRTTSWHLYILRLNLDRLRIDRNQFIQELAERGVSTSVHFIPLHLQPVYQRDFGYKAGDYPNAEREFRRSLSLPIYSGMRDQEIEYVISCVFDVASQRSR
ncbi:MAG: DegT/DnrJ/EryC1/StrS family aminotransferase [Candidatus Sulfotelmatobacter sp.]